MFRYVIKNIVWFYYSTFAMSNCLSKFVNSFQAISLVTDVRTRLVNWRNDGWGSLLEDVKSFCTKNDIAIPRMDKMVTKWARTRKGGKHQVTPDHFYRVDTFYVAIDSMITEFEGGPS